MDVITFQQVEVTSQEKENLKPVQTIPTAFKEETEEELQMQETKKKNNRKKTALLMGQLHDDMMFLDKIANHPALQKNILILKEEDGKAPQKDIDKVKHFPSKNQKLPSTSKYLIHFMFYHLGTEGNTGSRNGRFAVFGGSEELLGDLRAAHQRGEEENTEEVEI